MSLKLVVLGSGGYVGQRLCRYLTKYDDFYISPNDKVPIKKIILFDKFKPKNGYEKIIREDSRMEIIYGDLCNKNTIKSIFSPVDSDYKYSNVTVIHIAALLSGYSEKDFDLGMKINLYGSLTCLEEIRKVGNILNKPQIYFYASTDYVFAYNNDNINKINNEESFRLSPVSYGCQKACIEILLSDYTRKGYIDGRVGRYSAVIGKPQFADSISYAWNGVFSQTLQGNNYKCSAPLNRIYPCSYINNIVLNTIYLSSRVDTKKIGHNRVILLPNKSFTVNELWEKTKYYANKYKIDSFGKLVIVGKESTKTTVSEINVCQRSTYKKALGLGCYDDDLTIDDIIQDFIQNNIKDIP